MAKAASFANDVLDATLNNGASGTMVIGGTTYTLPLKLRFLSTVSTDTTAGTEWSPTGGYATGGVSLAGKVATAAANKAKANTADITVSNAPAGTWADNEVVDSSATPKRLVFKGAPSLAKTVNAGDTCTVAAGSLVANDA